MSQLTNLKIRMPKNTNVKFDKGPRPSMTEAIKAKCFDCTAEFYDGRRDCNIPKCPLHSRMPYRNQPSNFDWLWGPWSEKHRSILKKLGMTADEYVKNVLTVGKTAKGLPKYKVPLSDIIRAKCFRCCGDYSQECVTLQPLRQIKEKKKGSNRIITRTEKAKGPFAVIQGVKHKIIITNNEAGKVACSTPECPLFWWTPYRNQPAKYDWMFESDYTKRHRIAIAALGITEEEYIQRLLVEKSL